MSKGKITSIAPEVLAVTGEPWAQRAITALDRDSESDDSVVIGYLDGAGDIHKVQVVKTGEEIAVSMVFTPGETKGMAAI